MGSATQPRLAASGGKLYLLWADDRIQNLTGNTIALYVKQWNGTAFVEALPGDASGQGISNTGRQTRSRWPSRSIVADILSPPGAMTPGTVRRSSSGAIPTTPARPTSSTTAATQGDEISTPPVPFRQQRPLAQPAPSFGAGGPECLHLASRRRDRRRCRHLRGGITVPPASTGFLILGVPGRVANIKGLADLSNSSGVILQGLNSGGRPDRHRVPPS